MSENLLKAIVLSSLVFSVAAVAYFDSDSRARIKEAEARIKEAEVRSLELK